MPDREVAPGHRVQGRAADDDRGRRLDAVLRASRIQPARRPFGIESHSNDTYLIDDPVHGASVLRICYRGDIDRLPREAAIGRHLPPEIGYPEILSSGRAAANN